MVDKAALPARQDLRRRPHHRRAAPARRPRARRPEPPVVRAGRPRPCSCRPPAARSSCPFRSTAQYAGVVPRVELDAALVDHARGAGRRRPRARRRHRARGRRCRLRGDTRRRHASCRRAGSSRPTATTPPTRSCSTTRATIAPPSDRSPPAGTRSASTSRGVDDRRLWVLFEADLLPGYAWVFPVGGRPRQRRLRRAARPARGCTSGKALAAQWRDARRPTAACAASSGPTPSPRARVRAWPIPAVVRRRAAHARARAVRGDAADVVDPMTGEGIAQALETGMLAAPRDRRVTTRRRGRDVPLPRRRRPRPRARPPVRGAAATHPARPARSAGRDPAASLTPWTRRNFARWMFEDYPRALVLTPDRWRRGMFTTAGAYSLHSTDGRH